MDNHWGGDKRVNINNISKKWLFCCNTCNTFWKYSICSIILMLCLFVCLFCFWIAIFPFHSLTLYSFYLSTFPQATATGHLNISIKQQQKEVLAAVTPTMMMTMWNRQQLCWQQHCINNNSRKRIHLFLIAWIIGKRQRVRWLLFSWFLVLVIVLHWYCYWKFTLSLLFCFTMQVAVS